MKFVGPLTSGIAGCNCISIHYISRPRWICWREVPSFCVVVVLLLPDITPIVRPFVRRFSRLLFTRSQNWTTSANADRKWRREMKACSSSLLYLCQCLCMWGGRTEPSKAGREGFFYSYKTKASCLVFFLQSLSCPESHTLPYLDLKVISAINDIIIRSQLKLPWTRKSQNFIFNKR